MSTRNRLAILLTVVSLVLLWPGLVQPALTVRATMDVFGTTTELANQTRSVVGAIRSLHQSGDNFVAGLILLFSVVVPLTKVALLVPILGNLGSPRSVRYSRIVQSISKWAMADVFAVGTLIALLVAKGTANLSADAGPGFYFFAAYCLVSNAAFQLLKVEQQPTT